MAAKKTTFKDDLGNLESIVDKLESGDLDLEDALKEYEKGVGLVCSLNKKLESSKLKINELAGKIEADNENISECELSHS